MVTVLSLFILLTCSSATSCTQDEDVDATSLLQKGFRLQKGLEKATTGDRLSEGRVSISYSELRENLEREGVMDEQVILRVWAGLRSKPMEHKESSEVFATSGQPSENEDGLHAEHKESSQALVTSSQHSENADGLHDIDEEAGGQWRPATKIGLTTMEAAGDGDWGPDYYGAAAPYVHSVFTPPYFNCMLAMFTDDELEGGHTIMPRQTTSCQTLGSSTNNKGNSFLMVTKPWMVMDLYDSDDCSGGALISLPKWEFDPGRRPLSYNGNHQMGAMQLLYVDKLKSGYKDKIGSWRCRWKDR